ncbi:nucleotidyl transferase AbiEii/AbiGii toxin family protein [Lentisphaera marina]|uniref:nucleotidyl transferase AbiEii/AbiGii toxin family protein n=1 Tax=Lentisphaera marina TaxID=1111041 RepID=UPI0023651DED|nr:nucleotidyl transferase AbiEii/AbiGii toxin family protein [Lentisphaera marina]MDD7986669.1 nucleotidyl transferase AbiEii/AbiGii toxin family protein [Lentisphaera marina]
MSSSQFKNTAHSVKQRLLNKAREEKRPFNEILQYYAMERYLYRLSCSDYADRFILKGGLMLYVWNSPVTRPTMDIDLLAYSSNELEVLKGIFQEVCQVNCKEDGLSFAGERMQALRIKEDADYEGVRLTFFSSLGTAKVRMQIDVGFGDVIHPGFITETLSPLLKLPAASLACYPRESVIAEKLQAMMALGMLNSRMKDFYDIFLLASNFSYEGSVLAEAISKTLQHRETEAEVELTAFTEAFTDAKQVQWTAFRRKLKQEDLPADIKDIISLIKQFIGPVLDALVKQKDFNATWPVKGPWAFIEK